MALLKSNQHFALNNKSIITIVQVNIFNTIKVQCLSPKVIDYYHLNRIFITSNCSLTLTNLSPVKVNESMNKVNLTLQ